MSFYRSQAFKEEEAKWYEKLKQQGFDDIESQSKEGQAEYLKVWHHVYFINRYDTAVFSNKENYYRLAGRLLYDYSFRSSADKRIWKLHSEGRSVRGIAKTLGFKLWRVQKTIAHLKAEMMAYEYE